MLMNPHEEFLKKNQFKTLESRKYLGANVEVN